MIKKFSYLLFGVLFYCTFINCNLDSGTNSNQEKIIYKDTLYDTVFTCPNTDSTAQKQKEPISVSYTINILGNPNKLLISKDGKKVYATNGSGLLEIGITERKVLKNYSLPNASLGSNDISIDGKLMSLSDFYSVYIANIDSGMTFRNVIGGSAVYGSCIANGTVYAPCFNDRIVRTYRLQNGTQKEINPFAGSSTVATPHGISYTMDRNFVVAIDEGQKVLHIINTNNDSMLYQIPTGRTAKFTIPLNGDTIAAFCQNSNQILLINVKEPEAVPVIIKIDSLEYVTDATYSISNNRMYIILAKSTYYQDNGPYESGQYSLPELLILDMKTRNILKRGMISVNASNVYSFSIALTPDSNLLLITGSEAIYVIDVNTLKI